MKILELNKYQMYISGEVGKYIIYKENYIIYKKH